jgi:hypothetical protein
MLAYFEEDFEAAGNHTRIINKNWASFILPENIKKEFIQAWEGEIEYPAEDAPGIMKLHTSSVNSQVVADSDVAKGICTFPVYRKLHELRAHVLFIAQSYGISTFKSEFKKAAKDGEKPPSWDRWCAAIKSEFKNSEEVLKIKDFLTDSGKFHGIKGIAREDFALPAVCKSIGMRVDRFGIADQIVSATNESIHIQVKDFVAQLERA